MPPENEFEAKTSEPVSSTGGVKEITIEKAAFTLM